MPVAKKLHDSCHWLPGNLAVYLRQEEVQLMKLVPGVTQAAPPQGSAFNCQLHTGCKDYQKISDTSILDALQCVGANN